MHETTRVSIRVKPKIEIVDLPTKNGDFLQLC